MNLGFGPGRKSPTVARWLSIIPGLGHIYAGEYFSGIIWFIVGIPVITLLVLVKTFIPGMALIRPSIYTLVLYAAFFIWCSRDASRIVADKNARKAAQAEFANKKKQKAEFERLKEEARKRLEG
jgi:hypothetical protein